MMLTEFLTLLKIPSFCLGWGECSWSRRTRRTYRGCRPLVPPHGYLLTHTKIFWILHCANKITHFTCDEENPSLDGSLGPRLSSLRLVHSLVLAFVPNTGTSVEQHQQDWRQQVWRHFWNIFKHVLRDTYITRGTRRHFQTLQTKKITRSFILLRSST